MQPPPLSPATLPATTTSRPADGPRAAAEALEASFLSEMLKATGLGEQKNSFSGSTGESQFASFHRDAIARELVRSGGIGLADMIEASLKERLNEDQ